MMKKKGMALIVVIVVISVIMILSVSLIGRATSSFKTTTSSDSINRVNLMAESGMELALNKIKAIGVLTNNLEINSSSEDNTINLKVNIYASTLAITSTAKETNGNYSKTITVNLNKTTTNTIPQIKTAIFANGSISLTGSGSINGDVGTNLQNLSGISCKGSGEINGNKIFNCQKNYPEFVLPSFPTGLTKCTDIDLKGKSDMTISANGYYNNINMSGSGKLYIDTSSVDTIGVKSLSKSGSGTVVMIGSGKLKIYVDNSIDIEGSGDINNKANKDKLEIYSNSSNEFKITGSGSIYGSLYLGSSDLTITGSGSIIGDIVTAGQNVKLSGSLSAGPRILYAPNASIKMTGSGSVNSVIVCDQFDLSGSGSVSIPTGLTLPLDVILPGTSGSAISYTIKSWN